LVLDSGASRVILFGVRPEAAAGELRTIAGSQYVGLVCAKPLVVAGRRIWDGDAVAIPSRSEAGVDGLLPLSLFRAVYFCNSEGYLVFE
jgi:hypothetical protein